MDFVSEIYKRKSIRKYLDKTLSLEQLNEIKAICSKEERLHKEVNLNIAVAEDGNKIQSIMSGLIGNFIKVTAPHYLIVTSEQKLGYMENAGYTVEKVVLKLTFMGIATCWLGGNIKENELKEAISIPENHKFIVMVSLGYPMDKENLYRESTKEAKRKEISEFARSSKDESYDEIWQVPLEAVRIAPSAANTQPWRFVIEDKKAHVFCEGPSNFITKKLLGEINTLDVGIALSHLQLAAEATGKKMIFIRDHQIQHLQGKYIITAEIL
jgi:nitroreductase